MIEDSRRAVELTLFLSQSVPYHVFTLDDPRRLVMDFREVDFVAWTQAPLIKAMRCPMFDLARCAPVGAE